MKKTKFIGVNGDEIFLMEGKNNTVVEIGKMEFLYYRWGIFFRIQ